MRQYVRQYVRRYVPQYVRRYVRKYVRILQKSTCGGRCKFLMFKQLRRAGSVLVEKEPFSLTNRLSQQSRCSL